MSRNTRLGIMYLLLSTMIWGQLSAQDVLYLKDGSKLPCKITAIEGPRLRYKMQQNLDGPDYIVPKQRLLMLFYEDGSFAVFDPSESMGYRSFAASDGQYDRILLQGGEISFVSILSLDDVSIVFTQAGSTVNRPVSELLLVVRRDGSHEIRASNLEELANVLKKVKVGSPGSAPGITDQPVQPTNPDRPVRPGGTDQPVRPGDPDPVQPVEPTDPGPSDLKLDLAEFERKAIDKVESLGSYFAIIADKETPWQEANNAIEQALLLFLNEEAQVEVSSLASPTKRQFPIRAYLDRMKLLHYDQVEISWSEINYVSNLKKGADGNYYGVISFLQKFTGYQDNVPVYTDLTRKNIQIVLKGYTKETAEGSIDLWDVFLSDIGVVSTK
ncbi:MAG: hypothetical protein OHK0039_13960 [Bacteroidia bacterium]